MMNNQEMESKFNGLINMLSKQEKMKNRMLGTYTLQVLTAIKYLQSLILNFQMKGKNE